MIATIVCSVMIVWVAASFITVYTNNIIGVRLMMSTIFVVIADFIHPILKNEINKTEV